MLGVVDSKNRLRIFFKLRILIAFTYYEAVSIKDGPHGGFFLTVEEIQELLAMHLVYSPVLNFKFMSRTAGFGNAILSKLPVQNQNTFFTGKQLVKDFDFNRDDYNIRNLLHVSYVLDGQPLHILTHHGHHVALHKNGDEETLKQCKLIANYVDKLAGKIILTGDFNLAPHSKSLEQINYVLTNECIKHGIETTRTIFTTKNEVCDYVFTNDKIKAKKFKASEELVSGHSALIMEFA